MQKLAESSSIHGIKYIFASSDSKFARVLWIFIVFLSFVGFGYYVRTAYIKLQISPDISLSTRQRDFREFPYPAVTICPNIFADHKKTDIFKFINLKRNETSSSNVTKSECMYAIGNSHWCLYGNENSLESVENKCKDYLEEFDAENPIKLIRESMPKIYTLDNAKDMTLTLGMHGICYTNNLQDFESIFTEEIHDDFKGLFQSYDKSFEWTPERGYFQENSSFPYRIAYQQRKSFKLLMDKQNSDNECVIKKNIIIIHVSNEIPTEYRERNDLVYLENYEMIDIDIDVKSYKTDIDLKDFSVDFRKCYFENERKLKFFKMYSINHCKLECLANITLEKFGCVKFFMPRDSKTRICKFSELKKMLASAENLIECGCLPLCNDIKYSFQKILKNPITRSMYPENYYQIFAMSSVDFSYSDEPVEEIEKFIAYKLQNFISDIGGLLGLFLGCSLVSIVEIFFLIFQAFINMFKKPENELNEILKKEVDELRSELENLREKLEIKEKVASEKEETLDENVDVTSLSSYL